MTENTTLKIKTLQNKYNSKWFNLKVPKSKDSLEHGCREGITLTRENTIRESPTESNSFNSIVIRTTHPLVPETKPGTHHMWFNNHAAWEKPGNTTIVGKRRLLWQQDSRQKSAGAQVIHRLNTSIHLLPWEGLATCGRRHFKARRASL